MYTRLCYLAVDGVPDAETKYGIGKLLLSINYNSTTAYSSPDDLNCSHRLLQSKGRIGPNDERWFDNGCC